MLQRHANSAQHAPHLRDDVTRRLVQQRQEFNNAAGNVRGVHCDDGRVAAQRMREATVGETEADPGCIFVGW